MSFLIAGIVGAGAGLAGGIMTNSANSMEGQRNRDFQKYMLDTQYQRARGDKIAAGINPILDSAPAGGASGSMASQENPAGNLAATAMQMGQLKREQAKTQSEVAFNAAAERNQTEQAASAQAQKKLTEQMAKQKEFENQMLQKYGEVKEWMGMINSGTQSISNTAGAISDIFGKKIIDKISPNFDKVKKDLEHRRLEKAGIKGIILP